MGDERHIRRLRCYEFGYVVPWDEIVARMERGNSQSVDTDTHHTGGDAA